MNCRKAVLVIHKNSYKYIKGIGNYLRNIISDIEGERIELRLVDQVDAANEENALFFVIGNMFPPFNRRTSSRYVLLNFSLLFKLGRPWQTSWKARKWINNNLKQLLNHVRCFDVVLDFYPAQTSRLRDMLSHLPVRVLPFMVNVDSSRNEDIDQKKQKNHDICVVGSVTPRRAKIYNMLRNKGLVLSGYDTEDFAGVIKDSKIVLNVHAQRCVTFESPRIVEALRLGACLVTEPCFGMSELIPPECCFVEPYSGLVDRVSSLIRDESICQQYGNAAKSFFLHQYDDRCRQAWKDLGD